MDDESDFGGRGDEMPYYPPIGSPEWEARMRKASADLLRAQAEIFEHCDKINEAVHQIFHGAPRG